MRCAAEGFGRCVFFRWTCRAAGLRQWGGADGLLRAERERVGKLDGQLRGLGEARATGIHSALLDRDPVALLRHAVVGEIDLDADLLGQLDLDRTAAVVDRHLALAGGLDLPGDGVDGHVGRAETAACVGPAETAAEPFACAARVLRIAPLRPNAGELLRGRREDGQLADLAVGVAALVQGDRESNEQSRAEEVGLGRAGDVDHRLGVEEDQPVLVRVGENLDSALRDRLDHAVGRKRLGLRLRETAGLGVGRGQSTEEHAYHTHRTN